MNTSLSIVAGVVLAAGRSDRWGPGNKLLAPVGGVPMARRVVLRALDASLDPIVVVTGHDGVRVRGALRDLPVHLVHNPSHDRGLSSSLARGIERLGAEVEAAFILLADMPGVRPLHLNTLAAAWDPESGVEVCVPTWEGRRGNPVLWGARFFPELQTLQGDRGARDLLERHREAVREVPMPDDGVVLDVDTPAALDRLQAAEPSPVEGRDPP
jgi:molybdenum cofactor cytidylyltransferase